MNVFYKLSCLILFSKAVFSTGSKFKMRSKPRHFFPVLTKKPYGHGHVLGVHVIFCLHTCIQGLLFTKNSPVFFIEVYFTIQIYSFNIKNPEIRYLVAYM